MFLHLTSVLCRRVHGPWLFCFDSSQRICASEIICCFLVLRYVFCGCGFETATNEILVAELLTNRTFTITLSCTLSLIVSAWFCIISLVNLAEFLPNLYRLKPKFRSTYIVDIFTTVTYCHVFRAWLWTGFRLVIGFIADLTSGGRAIAPAVSRRLPTAAARVQTRVWSSGIFWWTKVALGQVFSENFGFVCQSTFHLLLHNHLHNHRRLAQ
jgi:hypothetical protein